MLTSPFRICLTAVLLVGCQGMIEMPVPGGDPTPVVTPPGQIPDNHGGSVASKCVSPDALGPSDRLSRLTHIQYGNIVRDVLGLPADIAGFAQDSASGGFTNNASALLPNDRLVRDWNRSAEALAEQVATTATALNTLAPCAAGQTQACFNTFVDKVGYKLYRRPLSAAQKTKLQTAWTAAGPIYSSGTQYQKAVRMAIEAMLQSPAFLYRAELSSTMDPKGGIPLNGFEIGERLSFALWSSGPDDALLAAAAAGALATPAGIQTQARRLLADPKARTVMRDFYFQWLRLSGYSDLMRSATLFPNFNTALAGPMQEEALRFLEDLTFDTNGNFKDFYTAPHTFVNAPLAKLYGLNGITGNAFERVELDPKTRGGLLTQLGFLASNAYVDADSPIHRGAFVLKRLMCEEFHPPGGISVMLPPVSADLKTTRQRVASHTGAKSCQVCHSSINAVGFTFEHYDAVGQWRDQDNGVPVDASGALPSPAALVDITQAAMFPNQPVADVLELGAQLAAHETAQKCFSAMWLRYLYSRLDYPEDACQVEDLSKKLALGTYPLKDLVVDLVSARAFTTRTEATP
jgi:hypothetical protein